MKRFLLLIIFFIFTFFILPAKADILPMGSKSVKYYGIGVLNMPLNYTVYQYPYKEAKILKEVSFENIQKSAIRNRVDLRKVSYIAYVPEQNLALLPVELEPGNDWYCVYINQDTGEKGWVYNEDKSAFMTYRRFFYKYGKKYGIRFFNDLTDEEKVLYAKEDLNSQVLERIKYPRFATFTAIRGNWMLVVVNDASKKPRIGWLNWRNDDGSLKVFPHLKEQKRW